jgi:hypothetical protein
MSVVTDVGMDDEDNLTWDEVAAAFRAAAPAAVVRSPRRVSVVYLYADRTFTATSPDIPGFRVSAGSLREARRLAAEDLSGFLDPAVEVVERIPRPGPEITTAACGVVLYLSSPAPLFEPDTLGTADTFVSPARAAQQRTQTA